MQFFRNGIMIVENQQITVKWTKANKEHYENLGYTFTNMGDEFCVPPEHLTKGSHAKVQIQCDYCGKIVEARFRDYKKSKGNTYACQSCKGTKIAEETLQERREYLYNAALDFCHKMGYILLTPIEEIENSGSRVEYKCPIHGVHEVKIYNLITGHQCKECSFTSSGEHSKLSKNEVNRRIEECGGIWLNQDEYTGWADKNLNIICPGCHKPFITSLNSFTKRGGQFCPECSTSESNGEARVRIFLDSNDIPYIQEYRFDDCRDKNALPFDFYIPNSNITIEFQGAQHYAPVSKFGGDDDFELRKKHDDIKRNYCKSNDIKLIEIPYWDINKVDEILRKELIA